MSDYCWGLSRNRTGRKKMGALKTVRQTVILPATKGEQWAVTEDASQDQREKRKGVMAAPSAWYLAKQRGLLLMSCVYYAPVNETLRAELNAKMKVVL